jgi:hypothetical protein
MRKVQLQRQIVLRIPEPLRVAVEQAAERDRRTLADYLRLLITDAMAAGRAPRREQQIGARTS